MKKLFLLIIFLCVMNADATVGSYLGTAWNQYRAVAAYQGNQFDDAQKLLEQAVIDYPHDAQLNYNLGCAYHKLHKEEEALHCFSRSSSSPNLELAEQSYFNMGNSQVALNKIDDAISSYEKVLSLNPHNKAARHNLELIKQKKEQDKKEKKDNKQPKNDQQKDKEQQGAGDQSQNNQHDDKQQENKKEQNQQKDNSQKDKPESSDDRTKSDQSNQPNQQEKQKENDKKSKGNNNEQVDDKTGEQKSQQEKQSSASQKTASKGSREPLQHGQLSDAYDKKAGNDKLDKQLQLVLVEAETKDEEQYKKMIKAHVKREMPGQFGQKNW